jgi:hypothetical protein
MGSITIQNVDADLERCLKEAAARDNDGVNIVVLKTLRKAFGLEGTIVKKSDFSDLAGTWTLEDAREFEASTGVFSTIDEEMWK